VHPGQLFDRFELDHHNYHRCRGWTLLLRFLTPITVPGSLQIKVAQ
jgi:hypothetical protein